MITKKRDLCVSELVVVRGLSGVCHDSVTGLSRLGHGIVTPDQGFVGGLSGVCQGG
jgi:hypothetical protein